MECVGRGILLRVPRKTQPYITHITAEEWNKNNSEEQLTQSVIPDLIKIRHKSRLRNLTQKEPHIYTWLTIAYANRDIGKFLTALKNNKPHGIDGIPGETYKELRTRIAILIAKIMNKIKNGEQMPDEWVEGVVVHIYKNKGV